jgi:hypothetical protein
MRVNRGRVPFEPLRTDEKLDRPIKPQRDFDTQMILGCSGFAVVAMLTYGLTMWPFLTLPEAERIGRVALCASLGFLPASVIGAVASRRFGIPGATGFVAGAAVSALFLYLRLDALFIAAEARQGPVPDYPAAFRLLLPFTMLALAAAVAILSVRDVEEKEDRGM